MVADCECSQGEKTVEAIPYEAEPVGSPDCNDLHVLPGVELLGSGSPPPVLSGHAASLIPY
jgi:hypothetical protein